MSETKRGNLISVRDDLKVVDATIRDGGLVNDFRFTDEFVKDLYETNIAAGVDYMEFGYKASKKIFPEEDFGKWKFCDEESIRGIVGENDSDLKISVMADVGRTDMDTILPKSESVVDLMRTATYVYQIPSCIEMVEDFHKKGYETSANIMAVSTANDGELDQALELLCKSSVDIIYLVDSYGALYPEDIRRLTAKYLEFGEKYNKKIGIHAHDNQQLAFANTIESMIMGTSYLDGTVRSLGRGAGNCALETLLGFLKNPKYNLVPLLDFIEKHMVKLHNDGLVWGYDVPYLLTGRFNCHPRTAIAFMKEKRTDYAKFFQETYDQDN